MVPQGLRGRQEQVEELELLAPQGQPVPPEQEEELVRQAQRARRGMPGIMGPEGQPGQPAEPEPLAAAEAPQVQPDQRGQLELVERVVQQVPLEQPEPTARPEVQDLQAPPVQWELMV